MADTWLPPRVDYEVRDGRIITDGSVRNRITGTALAAILGESPWSTPFQVACELLGLARKDISNKPAVKTGVILEPRIIEYAKSTYPEFGTFLAAEEVFEKREGDHDSWASDFEDEVFGGHVDGLVTSPEGDNYILEIKTSANMDSWTDGVPIYYQRQVGLYNEFLTEKDKAYVVLGIVDSGTYASPISWCPSGSNVGMFEMNIDREWMKEGIDRARAWYDEFIMNNTTPEPDPLNPKDMELFNKLCNLTDSVESIQDLIAQYDAVTMRIEEAENRIKVEYDTAEFLKKKIKDYMDVHTLSELTSKDGVSRVVLQSSPRKSYDYARMEADGIDLTRYTTTTTTKTFKFKRKK